MTFTTMTRSEDIRNSAGDSYNPPVNTTCRWNASKSSSTRLAEVARYRRRAGKDRTGNPFTGNWDQYLKHWNETDYTVTQTDPDNSDNTSTRTFPAGTLLFLDKRAPLVKEPYFHRLMTCIFLYDPDMWCHRLPDMGPRCLNYLGTKDGSVVQVKPPGWPKARVTVTDTMGRPFGGSAELDGEGNQAIPDSSRQDAAGQHLHVVARRRRRQPALGRVRRPRTVHARTNPQRLRSQPMLGLKVTSRSEITVQKTVHLGPGARTE